MEDRKKKRRSGKTDRQSAKVDELIEVRDDRSFSLSPCIVLRDLKKWISDSEDERIWRIEDPLRKP